MIILLSLCLGLINAARGSGIKGGKVYTLLAMWLVAWTLTDNPYITGLFPVPLLVFWWKKGGTGSSMKAVLSWFHIPFIPEDHQWRAFELVSVFVYSVVYLGIATYS